MNVQPQPCYDLSHVWPLIESEPPVSVECPRQPGGRVRVKSGVLKGTEGVVLRRCDAMRWQVAMDCLQQGVSVEIDGALLEWT